MPESRRISHDEVLKYGKEIGKLVAMYGKSAEISFAEFPICIAAGFSEILAFYMATQCKSEAERDAFKSSIVMSLLEMVDLFFEEKQKMGKPI